MIFKLIRKINTRNYQSILLILLLGNSLIGSSREDSLINQKTNLPKTTLSINAYVDIFYAYDFNKPISNKRVPYMVNHNRHNEFNLNLGTIGASVQNDRYHANLVLQAGTYAIDNYVSENEIMRIVNEASAGIALTRNRKLWLDAGILGSHIGFESPFQTNDLTLTRTLIAESAPYFFTGAKLSYTFNQKWKIMGGITNGWQRINRVEGNSLMSFVTMLNFNPTEKVQLNWSFFIGTDDPDTTRRMRYYNEVYALISFSNKWTLHTGFDYGIQQKSKGSDQYNPWFLASILTQYTFHPHWALGFGLKG